MASKLPDGIQEGYQPVWDEFLNMKAAQQIRKESSQACMEDCFREVLRQAGAKAPTKRKTKDYVDFKRPLESIRTWWNKAGLNKLVTVHKSTILITYQANPHVCAAINVNMTGTLVLRPSRLRVLNGNSEVLARLDGIAWRTRPKQLLNRNSRGEEIRLPTANVLKPKDYYCVSVTDTWSLYMARTKTEILVKFTCKGAKVAPLVKSFDRDLSQIKRNQTEGVFK